MSCESGQEWSVEHAIQTCSTVQSMIDFTAKHLYGLRTQCAPNEQITQKEIRDTESKLIKLFSQQLVIKAKLANDQRLAEFPKIEKWLNIFGINEQAISVIVNKGILLTSLLKMNEEQVRSLFRDNNAEKEAIQELTTALKHLNAWTDKQIKGDSCDENDVELHWTRYTPSQSSSVANSSNISSSSSNTEAADGEGNSNGGEGTAGSGANEGASGNSRSISSTSTTGGGGGGSSGGGGGSGSGGGGGVDTGSPKYISCPSTSSLPSENFQPLHIPTSPQSTPSSPVPRNPKERHRGTPPPTPTLVRAKPMGSKYPSTPPPKKKIQLFPDASSLKKSRSCESQLASRVTNIDPVRQKKKPGNSKLGGSFEILINRRPSTEGSEAGGNSQGPSPVLSPAMRSPPYKADPSSLKEYHKTNTLPVPKSPIAPDQNIMVSTNHRFIIKPMFEICDYCRKHVLFGKICKDCRYKCHRDCANRAPNTCSLPLKYGSPKNSRRSIIKLVKSVPTLQRQDSGSNTSSCNSSTPSSPALPITSPASITSPSPAASPKVVPLPSQFPFPGEDHYPVSCSTPTEPAFFDVFCSQSAYPLNMNANHPANHLSSKALPNLSAVNKPSRHGSFHHFGRASPSSSPVCSTKKSNFHNVHFKRVPLESIPLPSRCACQHVYEHERKLGLYTYPCLNLGSAECVHCRSISTLCFPCFSTSSDKPCKHKDYKDFHASQGLRNCADKLLLSDQSHSGQLKKRVTGIPTVPPAALLHLPQAKGPIQSPLVAMSKLLPSLSSSSSSEYSGVNEQVPHWQYTNSDVVDGVIDPHLSKNLDYSQDIDVNTTTSDDSDRTLVPSIEDKTLLDRVDSSELAPEDSSEHSWTRQHSLSVQLKEWNIPFEDITIGDRIGIGRFGIVHKGHWHGDVAIKKLNIDPTSDFQAQLSAFKLEVAMLKKTRHENLVLFMGACMKPPDLAIVTSFCKGKSLFSSIYEFRQKFQFSKTVYIATQIAQGMGYLHARGIIHKDLKTKNIFWEETGKVVITDFGLFNLTKWCHGNRKGDCLAIPLGWLCYLSPEIMRSLQAGNTQAANTELPFSKKSDTYAFGTVWYELLCGEWPFKQQPPESIIWQVGRGIKQSLCHIITSRDVKDILMDCWGFDPKDRPEFSQIPRALARIPRKPLIRSPSHPVHLSRSVDSVYVA